MRFDMANLKENNVKNLPVQKNMMKLQNGLQKKTEERKSKTVIQKN